MTWRCPKGDEQSLLPAALGCRRTRGVLCRAVDVNGRRSSSHEVVHCIPTTARLANRLLGLAILWTARLGWGCTSGRCDGDQRKNNPRLRRSFAEQIIGAYLRITGRAALGPLATAVGASILDPWVSQIINPENLAQLLRGGTVSSELGPVSFRFGNLPSTLNLAWDAWLSSEYWFNRFSVWLPPGASQADQFRLRMQLLRWRWKITGIDLPEKLRDQIAGELAKKNP